MHDEYMGEAIAQARMAERCGEVPVGAVIVRGGVIVGRGHNLTETLKDPTAHAEVIAIRAAAGALGGWRLPGCSMYVTCEPCAMCAGAMVLARIDRVVIGAADPKSGACGSVLNVIQESRLNHRVEIEAGVMEQECAAMLKEFFRKRRKLCTEGTHR